MGEYLTANTDSGDLVIQIWLLQPHSLEWYFQPDRKGVSILRADELRTRAISFKPGGRLWWFFVHQGQIDQLCHELGDEFEIETFNWLAVLQKKDGLAGPEDALDAAVRLIELEGEISPSKRAYQSLAEDLFGATGVDQARYYVDRGNLQFAAGQWGSAALSFERATQWWPEWGLAHTKLGNAYRNLGRI